MTAKVIDGKAFAANVRAQAEGWRARLAAPFVKKHERLEFLRGRLAVDGAGQLVATPDPADGSHRLRAAAGADALLVLPEGARDFAAGDLVDVLPLSAD